MLAVPFLGPWIVSLKGVHVLTVEKILDRREDRDLGVPTGCLGDNCRFLRHSGPELASSGPPDVVRVYQSTSNRNGTSCYVPSIFKGFFYWDVAY